MFQYFKQYLKKKRLKYTRQREAIAKMFMGKKGHVCIDELYYALRKKYPHIGYATICRTIKLLEKSKIASEVNFTGRRRRFEQSIDRGHHDHFICQSCGKVIEFFDPDLEKKQEEICKKHIAQGFFTAFVPYEFKKNF